MLDCYIHQIGSMYDVETYNRLKQILNKGFIGSRKVLDENGISYNSPYKLNIKKEKENLYVDDSEHYDRVSLFDTNNRWIKSAIKHHSNMLDCFSPNFIAIKISKDIFSNLCEDTDGLAIGEVQVRNIIEKRYINGIVVPDRIESQDYEKYNYFVDFIMRIIIENGYQLNIYNYNGELIKNLSTYKSNENPERKSR